jgi:hypothetical protein
VTHVELLLCSCLQEIGYNAIHFNQLAHSWLQCLSPPHLIALPAVLLLLLLFMFAGDGLQHHPHSPAAHSWLQYPKRNSKSHCFARHHCCCCVHLQEMGYNAIHFNQLAHSWLRHVRIHNSDSSFYSWGMVFCTITGLEITSGDR